MTTLSTDDARALLARLLGEIAPEVSLDDVSADEDLRDELGLDSMDFLDLMVGVHDQTGFEVPERDYPRLATLDGAVRYLSEHVGAS